MTKPSLRSWFTVAILLVMTCIIAAERLHTMDEPLGRDVAGFAVLSHEMLGGRKLYSDLWERKPPLLFITYAAAELVTGYGPHELFVLNMAASVGTMIAIYFAGGVFAAVLWALLCGDLWVIGNQPTAEIFVSLFLATGFALMIRPSPRWILIGLSFAAATLFKHHVVVIIAALLLVDVLRNRRVAPSVLVVGIIAGVWAIVFSYFLVVGRFADFYSALFRQNAAYAGNLFLNVLESPQPKNILRMSMSWSVVPLALIAAWLAAGARNAADRAWPLLAVYGVFAWTVVALPGYFWGHYYQVLLPPFCIAGGWAAKDLLQPFSRGPVILRLGFVAAVFAITACWQAACYRLPPQQLAREQYVDDLPEEKALGEELNRLLLPSEHFWELGEENEIYFAARRSPPSGLLYLEPVELGPEREIYAARLLADLVRTKPELVILDQRWIKALPEDSGILPWVRSEYVPDGGRLSRYTYKIFFRRGSDLARRLGGLAR